MENGRPGPYYTKEGSGIEMKNQCQDQLAGPRRIWSTLSSQAREAQTGGDLLMNGGGLVLILASQPLISIPITPPLMPLHTSYPSFYPPESGGIEEADDSLTQHNLSLASLGHIICVCGIVLEFNTKFHLPECLWPPIYQHFILA